MLLWEKSQQVHMIHPDDYPDSDMSDEDGDCTGRTIINNDLSEFGSNVIETPHQSPSNHNEENDSVCSDESKVHTYDIRESDPSITCETIKYSDGENEYDVRHREIRWHLGMQCPIRIQRTGYRHTLFSSDHIFHR